LSLPDKISSPHGAKRNAGLAARLVPDSLRSIRATVAFFGLARPLAAGAVGERDVLAIHLSATDPSLGNGDAHERVGICRIGILFKDRQISKFARL
jgi:hypothetical protein